MNKKYIDLILEYLGDSYKVQLAEPQPQGGFVNWKIGSTVCLDVKLEVIGIYTRSIKLNLIFDKYKVEQLFFIPLDSSPNSILSKIHDKINAIVNDTLIDDNRGEEVKEMYKIKRENLFNKLKLPII